MTGTTPISGLRYFQSGDPAEIHTATQNLATDLDSKLVPRFATTAARNAAITSPVPGMVCWAGGSLWMYGSTWVAIDTKPLVIGEASLSHAVPASGAYLMVPSGSQQRVVGLTVSGGNFVTQVAGWYSLTMVGQWAAGSSAGKRILSFAGPVNSYGDAPYDERSAAGTPRWHNFAWEGFIAAGVTIQPRVYQDSGGPLAIDNIRVTVRLADGRITS